MDASLLYPNAEVFQTGLQELVDETPDNIRGVVIDCEVMADADTTGIGALLETLDESRVTDRAEDAVEAIRHDG